MLAPEHFPELIETIAASMRVIGTREGDPSPLPEDVVMDRARNAAMGVVGNFEMRPVGGGS